MKIYHNPRCSKSRQTLEIILQAGRQVEVIEYLKNPPSSEQLQRLTRLLDIPARELVRQGETQFKELKLCLDDMPETAIIQLLVDHPVLIQRPIVICGQTALIGRPPENVKQLLD